MFVVFLCWCIYREVVVKKEHSLVPFVGMERLKARKEFVVGGSKFRSAFFLSISLKEEGKNFKEFLVVLCDGLSHFYSFLPSHLKIARCYGGSFCTYTTWYWNLKGCLLLRSPSSYWLQSFVEQSFPLNSVERIFFNSVYLVDMCSKCIEIAYKNRMYFGRQKLV